MQGRTVRLYLIDGAPTGLLTAEIMNWTGHIFVTPRSRLGDALIRDEASRTGVYFLVGDDPNQATKMLVYVGEGDDIADRIRSHSKDDAKDFWTRVCLITSKDTNLTKAHARYLESRFIEIIGSSGRANLANGNTPKPKQLPESDVADMEYFIQQVQLALPVVGFDFLRPTQSPIASSGASVNPGLALVLESEKYGYKAEAIEAGGEIIVLKGSMAIAKGDFARNHYASLRAGLVQDGLLVPSSDPKYLEFSQNVPFESPSAAAAVIRDRNTNGRTSWRLKSTGETLKSWQDSQIDANA